MDEVSSPILSPAQDPDYAVGLALVRRARRIRIVETIKVGIVWILLIALLTAGLLQLRFDARYLFQHTDFVLRGVTTTIGVSLISILFASVLALFGALGRLSRNPIAQGISSFYISVIRGTPLRIQITLSTWVCHNSASNWKRSGAPTWPVCLR
jgi:polar amino acid transport system permease protein